MPQEGAQVEATGTSLQAVVENPRSEIPKVTFPKGRVAPLAGDQIKIVKLGILPGGESYIPAGYISSLNRLATDIVVGEQVFHTNTQLQTSSLLAIHSDPLKGHFLFLTNSGSIYALKEWQPSNDRSQIGKKVKSAIKKVFS